MATHLAHRDRHWDRQPQADAAYRAVLDDLLRQSPPIADFAARLLDATGIRLRDIVDHLELSSSQHRSLLEGAGWDAQPDGLWVNPLGMFPPFVAAHRTVLYVRAESMECFAQVHGFAGPIEGEPFAPLRKAPVLLGHDVSLGVIERNGGVGVLVANYDPAEIRTARLHLQAFRARRRAFDRVEDGLAHVEQLVDAAVAALGPHRACAFWLTAERAYWMQRCAAGRLQKARQDWFGLGWVNIDHHTYDSSRLHYRHTIRILERLGYERREMLYAGELAGWGSQVLEQPVIGSTIFADVDLAPEELGLDFAQETLPALPRHRRAGLLSALLGESILEAGLNHVAGLFDQSRLRAQLADQGVTMMAPFSDMPHLYQELTDGDWDAVDPMRVDQLEREGHIGSDEAEKLRIEGSIVTHLENIERNDGYKGFNREGIDSVLRKLDPRAYHGEAQAAVQ
ncbi:hypothetical protein [Blastomonas fulva]|jgi:hypothetical protein|uniref:hypothetical protein n=1 Tax=Blastomonas fulva TaxID=1550728 RepID=UPI003D2D3BA5